MNSGNDITVNVDIGRKQTQSARGVAAICSTARLFVEAGGDHHQFAAFEIVVIAVAKIDRRAQNRAVLGVGDKPLRSLSITINDDDFARATA